MFKGVKRADGKCEYCFKNLRLRNGKYRYVRDHVKPFKFFKDPSDNPHYRDNIRIIHHHCHDIKTSEIDKLLKSNNNTYECLDIVVNYFLDKRTYEIAPVLYSKSQTLLSNQPYDFIEN